jgi:NADH-quinone oxidoreductase subunit M
VGGLIPYSQDHLLSVIVLLPLVSVLVLGVVSAFARLSDAVWRVAGLVISLVGFGLTLELWDRFDSTQSGLQLVEHSSWIASYGINYYLGVDGISLFLVVLTGFLAPVILLAAWTDVVKRVKQFVFFMAALQTGMLGAFLSMNMFLFYVFWEVMLIPMYFVIGVWGGPRRIYATVKFFIYTMVGSLLMLIGILMLAYLHFAQAGVITFDYISHAGGPAILDTVIATSGTWWQTQYWLFVAFALAFAIKVPMFPFHTWLPDAHVEAPTAGSAVLAGILLKLGTYGFVRYALPLFPEATIELAPLLVALSLIGVVYGALVAMVQTDVKKLVAYSSVSHLGLVMVGVFALNSQGLSGSILQMVNHGISTGALFILVGMIYERRHTREIGDFGGIAHVMPVFATFFVVATMSSIGLPLLNGFVGEFLILLGAFGSMPGAAIIATSGIILGAVYMLWMVRRVFFGAVNNEENKSLRDLSLREKVVAFALVIPMFWIGVYPASFLAPMDRSVGELLDTMERRGADLTAYNGHPRELVQAEPAAGPAGEGAQPEPEGVGE